MDRDEERFKILKDLLRANEVGSLLDEYRKDLTPTENHEIKQSIVRVRNVCSAISGGPCDQRR